MKALDQFIPAPLLVTFLGGSQYVFNGQAGAEDVIIKTGNGGEIAINPVIGLSILGVLLLSGIMLVAREMRAEAKDARHRQDLDLIE